MTTRDYLRSKPRSRDLEGQPLADIRPLTFAGERTADGHHWVLGSVPRGPGRISYIIGLDGVVLLQFPSWRLAVQEFHERTRDLLFADGR